MERQVTIVSTKTQKKYVFTSNAKTLGELKSEMTNLGIEYDNMEFLEGISGAKYISDNQVLPKKVQYRGTDRNDLIFLLSYTKEKIKLG